ncbi:hypothetical protein KAX02_10955 [candidate division WOR-3 bacterium]|nr:hypothetical protein [candidate division WOR-3 bacterium]
MRKIDFFHGAVVLRIIRENIIDVINCSTDNNSTYILSNDIGIYIKYSRCRMSPWSFSFSKRHRDEIKKTHHKLRKLYVVLVCNDDGICCLDYTEFSTVLSIENLVFPKWIRVSRMKGEKYSVSGSDGRLKHKIGDSDFPKKVYD